jgi:hypothetical protein
VRANYDEATATQLSACDVHEADNTDLTQEPERIKQIDDRQTELRLKLSHVEDDIKKEESTITVNLTDVRIAAGPLYCYSSC